MLPTRLGKDWTGYATPRHSSDSFSLLPLPTSRLPYLKWLHLIGKRFVFTVHDVIPFDAKTSDLAWLCRLYHEADRIVVHAGGNRDAIVGKFKVGPDKVSVIPMGPYLGFAEDQKLSAPLAKQRLGLEPNTSVILFFGQIKRV